MVLGVQKSDKTEQQALVEKALKRDEAAFAELYDLHFEKIYRFVFFRVNHKETAEDLVAETFTKAWDKLREISDPRAFNGWLYQIARNLVIDYYRTRKPAVDLQELENVLEYEENIIDKANLGFQQEIFLKAVKNLSSDQQIVIKLKFIDELDNYEIARILNKSEGAIRVIQHRAISELRKYLNEHNS